MATKTRNGKSTQEIYAEVTERITAALEEEIIPWHRPWRARGGHRSIATGRRYRGINQWLLELSAMEKSYASPWWVTFKHAKEMSEALDPETYRGVRKDEESTIVVLWKKLIVEDEKNLDKDGKPTKKQVWYMREFKVFNIEQTDLPSPDGEAPEFEPIEAAEKIYPEMPNPPTLKHGGDDAFYAPRLDRVQLPAHGYYDSPEDYYSTQFHELGHATGHESRLNRDEITKNINFGSETYSKEELTAEMTAAMLCGIVGIDVVPRHKNTVAYIQNWMEKLGTDKKIIVTAASRAQRAADYILGEENDDGRN